eukprot:Sspe_Gene.96600::Locus_69505_Transcript_1_1_Confidence_1.000_Length_435::g.96600::m.96600
MEPSACGSEFLRMWLKPRGTTRFAPFCSSVIVPKDAVVDDLKHYIRVEFAPLLNNVSKGQIQIYGYYPAADDYVLQSESRPLATNPDPEVLRDPPGLSPSEPLFFDLLD